MHQREGNIFGASLLPQCLATPVGALEGVEDKGALLHTACSLARGVRGEPVVREDRVWRPMLLAVLKERHPHPRHLHCAESSIWCPHVMLCGFHWMGSHCASEAQAWTRWQRRRLLYLCELMVQASKLLEGLHCHRSVACCGRAAADRAVHEMVVLGSLQGMASRFHVHSSHFRPIMTLSFTAVPEQPSCSVGSGCQCTGLNKVSRRTKRSRTGPGQAW